MAPTLEEELQFAEQLAPFIDATATGQVSLDREEAMAAGIPAEYVERVAADLALSTEVDGHRTLSSCNGETSFSVHWWGQRLRLNSCHADSLHHMLAGGAAVSAVVAAVSNWVGAPVTAVAGVVAAVAGMGAWWVNFLNRNDCGVNIRWTFNVPNGSQQC